MLHTIKKNSIIGGILICISFPIAAQTVSIHNEHLYITIDAALHTKIDAEFPFSKKLMSDFSASEILQTKYYDATDFTFTKKIIRPIETQSGKGLQYLIFGIDKVHNLEKILQITTYNQFPNTAFFKSHYINLGSKNIQIHKWINHKYSIIPSTDTTKFWSFQGSSNADRADWIQKVNVGFYQENFMGMNAVDYGGGIPVIDLWRKDAGIAIGHTETVAKLVSLPVDFDENSSKADMHIEYEYPEAMAFERGDTLSSIETFISVHTKDCFQTLSMFSNYMQTKGIVAPAQEPQAFEPIWCAWGYERNFTIQEILNTLPKVKELGIKWVGLDDGYQEAEGDWHANKNRFENGDADMKKFVDSIHAHGLKAVLWWAPLAADPNSKILKDDANLLLIQADGAPQYITWWDAYMMAPTYAGTIKATKDAVKLFLEDWGFDALKLDGQHMNACAPDYQENHNITNPEQSFEQMPMIFKTIFETARSIKPNAVVEFCPCGDCMSFYHMPYTNQFVASDPLSSWQVRLKGKVYKAIMPATAYFGDHVELTDNKQDFASQVGIGAVPGTKFVWPATGISSKDENFLSPEKEIYFKKWIQIYNEKQLSKANYLGNLYDIGYDFPEAHCLKKADTLYYSFYANSYNSKVNLLGLDKQKKYRVVDYYNNQELGIVDVNHSSIPVSFNQFLLLEAIPF